MARATTVAFTDGSIEYKLSYGSPDSPTDGLGLYVGTDGAYIYPYSGLPLIVGTPGGLSFADLPIAPVLGAEENILDSNTDAWGDIIAGNGNHSVKGRYNGTSWTVMGR